MVCLLANVYLKKRMNESLKKESETNEISALVGELPTWSTKKTVFQIGVLLLLIGLIIYFTAFSENEKIENTLEALITVSEDGPIIEHMGYRYQFGEAGDVVVIRECNGSKLPWLLRVSTGELFRFDSWATVNIKEASLIRQIDGASGVTVTNDPICDQLVITKLDTEPLILDN